MEKLKFVNGCKIGNVTSIIVPTLEENLPIILHAYEAEILYLVILPECQTFMCMYCKFMEVALCSRDHTNLKTHSQFGPRHQQRVQPSQLPHKQGVQPQKGDSSRSNVNPTAEIKTAK